MAMEVSINPYESASMEDKIRWVIVYPAYLDAKKTQVEGRRIAKHKAVDVPQCSEIKDVCISQGLNAEIESKQYPREPARDNLHTGRVRVQLRKGDGSFVVPEITSRKDLYHKLCELIPKLKTRQGRGAEGGGTSGGGGAGSKKKKGKRR